MCKGKHDFTLGLPIFEPRDGGQGSSNTGNMARRIFQNHSDLLSKECNVPVDFVKGVHFIWIALASRLPLCPEKFQAFCNKIKELYVKELPWYPLNPSLHKIFEHGSEIIKLFPKTITAGMLSEEPLESSNKDVRKFQVEHARQCDPIMRNLDVFHRLLDRSDPHILNYFEKNRKKHRRDCDSFPAEVIALCKNSDEIANEMYD